MKTTTISCLLLPVFALTIASTATAAPAPKPTAAACKADLKVWSTQETGTLTIAEIDLRMTEMVSCANQTKHEKQMRAYLDDFYRTHSELATRAFNFITDHNLQSQFGDEEDSTESKKEAEPPVTNL